MKQYMFQATIIYWTYETVIDWCDNNYDCYEQAARDRDQALNELENQRLEYVTAMWDAKWAWSGALAAYYSAGC